MKRRAFLGWLSTLASQFLAACQSVPITEFLSTHPADVTRIRQIEQWLLSASLLTYT